jgi:hypothetical protein
MGTPKGRQLAKIPGKIILDPTDLDAADPYGGTEFGFTRDQDFGFGQKDRPIRAEEFGCVVESVLGRAEPIFAAVLRTWDDDALATVFPDTETGSSGRVIVHGRVKGSGVVRPGALVSGRAVKVLFVPESPDRYPWLILYRALPAIAETASLRLAVDESLGIGVVFRAIPDTSDPVRLYDIGYRGDLTL